MELILLETVHGLGSLGDAVTVKPGYARNYLVPQGKAVQATPENVAEFEARRAELERQQADLQAAARARAAQLADVEVTIECKAGEEGRLFGSVGPRDVGDALVAAGYEIERQQVRLAGDNIRQVGDYEAAVQFHADVEATVTVHVVAEG